VLKIKKKKLIKNVFFNLLTQHSEQDPIAFN